MAEYDYDDAGNRKPARESGGGTVSGGNYSHPLLTANYPANALSQYSGIASPQQFDVPGRRAVGGVGGNTVNIDISSQNVGSPAGAGYQPNRGNCYAKRIANYIAHMNRRFFSSLLISLPVGSIACKENVKTDIVGHPNGNALLPREVHFGTSFSTMVLRVVVAQNEKPKLKVGLDGPAIVIKDETLYLYDTHIVSYERNKAYVDPTGNYPLVMDCYFQIMEQMLSRSRDVSEARHAREFMQSLDGIASILERAIIPVGV